MTTIMDVHGVRSAAARLLERPSAPGAVPPGRRDWILVGALACATVAEGTLRTDLVWPVATTVLTVVLLAALPWRRTRPLAALGIVVGAGSALELAQTAAGHPATTLVTAGAAILLPYALYRWGSGRAIAGGTLLLVAGFAVSIVADSGGTSDLLAGVALLALVIVLGESVRQRTAARERDLGRARLAERESIARDLHDTVAHRMSAIAVRAQAGQVTAATDPGSTVEALEVVEREARTALAEMRSLVGTLRADGDRAAMRPAPGVDDLVALAGPAGAGVPAVRVRVADGVTPLTPSVATAVYRIAQESLTNARRHARSVSRVDVDLTRAGGEIRLRVHDDGAPAGARSSTGYGVAGMAERARLLGGSCTAGPDRAGGWTVDAVLPTGAVS